MNASTLVFIVFVFMVLYTVIFRLIKKTHYYKTYSHYTSKLEKFLREYLQG